MQQFVDVLSLNFRSAPSLAPETRAGTLFLGAPVEAAGPVDAAGFVAVDADPGSGRRRGFVAARHLRAPVADTREALIAQAVEEWLRFERGLGLEHHDPFFRFVGEMFRAIGLDLDGRDRDVPWSAAAISFMVRRAGAAYGGFRFAAAHARYIRDAIRRREAGDVTAPFWGFRPHERRPQLGDLVCRWRETRVDFETARARDDYKSHCDVVVGIDSAANTLLAIGGNVSQSVSVSTYRLAAGDFLGEDGRVFALLANITDRA